MSSVAVRSSRAHGIGARFAREVRRNPVLATATVGFLAFVAMAAFAHLIAPHPLEAMNLRARLVAPGVDGQHVLGTDHLGRDVWTRILFGVRSSLLIAGTATLLAAVAGIALGIVAGYVGKGLDAFVMRLVDVQLAVPAFFFALAGTVILGASVPNMVLVLALVGWAQFARVARASTLSVKEEPYVEAAQGLGARAGRIGTFHVLPNILGPALVVLSVRLPAAIMIEASLSFVGMGLPASVPSLGTMINQGYSHMLSGSWWISILPGVVLMILVMTVNTIADTLRDLVDVKIRH